MITFHAVQRLEKGKDTASTMYLPRRPQSKAKVMNMPSQKMPTTSRHRVSDFTLNYLLQLPRSFRVNNKLKQS